MRLAALLCLFSLLLFAHTSAAPQRARTARCPPRQVEFCKKLVRGELKGYFRSVDELAKALEKCAELKDRKCF